MKRWFWVFIVLFVIAAGFAVFRFRYSYSDIILSPLSLSEFPKFSPYIPVSLQMEQIFSDDHTWTATLSADKKVTLIASGDIIPARSVNHQTIKYGDFTWAWKNIAPIFSTGDITLINLESPLVAGCPATVEGMIFCGDQRHIQGLLFAGVTIANFANNHMGNYGVEGIEETKQLLEKNSIAISGLEEPAIINVKGLKFVFVGFDDIGTQVLPIAGADSEKMKKEITKAKTLGDVVIVSASWGVEYTDQPSERQKELAHLAVDSGADLVIGNHPHWIQPVEFYKGKMIMYAHGNTIFDQMWSEKTKEGVIGKYTFYDKILVDAEFIPIYIKDYGQPMLLEGEKRQSILDQLKQISLSSF